MPLHVLLSCRTYQRASQRLVFSGPTARVGARAVPARARIKAVPPHSVRLRLDAYVFRFAHESVRIDAPRCACIATFRRHKVTCARSHPLGCERTTSRCTGARVIRGTPTDLPTSSTARPGDMQKHPPDGPWICGQSAIRKQKTGSARKWNQKPSKSDSPYAAHVLRFYRSQTA